MTGYQAAGTASLDAQITASAASIVVADAKIHADGLASASPSIYLGEPQLDVAAAGSWTTKDRRLNIASASLTDSTLDLRGTVFVLAMPDGGPVELAGTVQYQGNLTRLRQCFASRTAHLAWSLGGMVAGGVQFKQSAGVIHAEAGAEVTNLIVADAAGQQFQEPKISLTALGQYDNKTKLVSIEKAEIASSTVAASAWEKSA